MPVNEADLQTALLRLLVDTNPMLDRRLGSGNHYLAEALRNRFPVGEQPRAHQIMATVWALISQGLTYIDYSQPAASNWTLHLTPAGIAAARDQASNPNNAGDYLTQLQRAVPATSQTVLLYAMEAANAYTARCYLASAVMLGVASEAAFQEMLTAFTDWLPTGQQDKFRALVTNPRATYLSKFDEFRKRLEPLKPSLPEALANGLTLTFDAVLDLLRIYRNESGHPTGKRIDRETQFISLQMFVRYVEKLYDLRAFFAGTDSSLVGD